MKILMTTLIAMCIILTGCNQMENESKLSKDMLTLEKVTTALKTEGMEMFEGEQKNDWVLNKVKPNRFSVSRPNVKEAYAEHISIYVYNSEKARKDGLNNFNNQKENYDMMVPNIYEHKNVLILYWHHENVDNAENAKFNKQIEMAIQKI